MHLYEFIYSFKYDLFSIYFMILIYYTNAQQVKFFMKIAAGFPTAMLFFK